jgi:hypothetical protein
LAILGKRPANNAEYPSLRAIWKANGMVASTGEDDEDIIKACRRVFRTSKGEVSSAAVIPLIAPLMKATDGPPYRRRENDRFHAS